MVIHTCQSYVHSPRVDSSDWASGGAKFPKMENSLPRTPTNHRAKFDATSVILAGEIRNHTNKQTKEQTNSNRYIHTLPIGMCG